MNYFVILLQALPRSYFLTKLCGSVSFSLSLQIMLTPVCVAKFMAIQVCLIDPKPYCNKNLLCRAVGVSFVYIVPLSSLLWAFG